MTNGHHVQVETIDGGAGRDAVMVEVYSIQTGQRVGKAYGYPNDNNVVYWMAKRIEELNALCSAQQREIDVQTMAFAALDSGAVAPSSEGAES